MHHAQYVLLYCSVLAVIPPSFKFCRVTRSYSIATHPYVLFLVAITSLIYRSSSSPLLDVYQLLAIVQTEGKTGGGLGTRLV